MGGITITTNMRLFMIPSYKPTSYNRLIVSSFGRKPSKVWCKGSTAAAHVTGLDHPSSHVQHDPPRRSANYGPTVWDFNYLQSLNSEYTGERYLRRVSELKVEVKKMLVQEKELSSVEELLELIDELQRLGISYHFEDEINQILGYLYEQKYGGGKNNTEGKEKDLYSTALEFRLLRQHGFIVPQETFDCFKNERGDLKPSLGDDTKGLLQLYEASFLSTPGEKTLELAREFATISLQKNFDENMDDENLALLVRHALELPIHWRVQRPNTRWFIEAYERRADANPLLLELAKLDFNIVQATHQQELKHIYEWWKQTGLAEKLPFARDRMVECYFWAIGFLFHPQYGYARIITAKAIALVLVIDDIFDVYGTPEELQLFNNAIQRWMLKLLTNFQAICKSVIWHSTTSSMRRHMTFSNNKDFSSFHI
ncbi:(R)-limonene synthase [Sesamum angolense]|uniref:(R)-limonene synthase n=1 Tax=Sesamum angolense TaxID=2727404 RepID=A0AAE1WYW9_9LAMI|nr:(R)-limonene synthase [Sesamum angolense]